MRSFYKRALAAQVLSLAVTAPLSVPVEAAPANQELVYVGTHGLAPPGATAGTPTPIEKATQGIYQSWLDLKTGALSVPLVAYELDHATSLVSHPTLPIIYAAAAEAGSKTDSDLFAFKIDKANERLVTLNKADSGGHGATAFALDGRANILYAAHYVSGSVSAVQIREDGGLGAVISSQTQIGSGPSPKQMSAHAQDVVLDPEHRYALVTDLGADRIFLYRINPTTGALSAAKIPSQAVPLGSGPRHLAFHPNGKYVFVDTEIAAELRSYRWSGRTGHLVPIQTVQAFPAGHSAEKSASELALSKDGRFAYLSLRGDQDALVVYAIDASRGTLLEIQRMAGDGKTPWTFGIDPSGRYLLVIYEKSNSVSVLSVDPESGRLSTTGQSVTIPRPVSVVFPSEQPG